MATTPTYINQRINNLQAQINSIISGGGGGVPTSSNLAVVLDNGNSAGTFDIDMNSNDIINADSITATTNLNLNGADVIVTATNSFQVTAVSGVNLTGNSLQLTSNSFGISLNSTAQIDIISTDYLNVNAGTDIDLNAGTGDITLATPSFTNINLDAYNINAYGYALPICFTKSTIGSFTYNLGGQNWEQVFNIAIDIPAEFVANTAASGYTSTDWKIDFALNTYNCAGSIGDKGLGVYFELQDPIGGAPIIPQAYNNNTPYTAFKQFGFTNNGNQPFFPYNWTDVVDLSSIATTGSNSLDLRLYFAADGSFTSNFYLVVSFTRTNLI